LEPPFGLYVRLGLHSHY